MNEQETQRVEIPEDVAAMAEHDLEGTDDIRQAVDVLERLNREPSGPVPLRLRQYRENSATLLKAYRVMLRLVNKATAQVSRYEGKTGERQRKRWTEGEDFTLIEFASQNDRTITELSTIMGRSPGAITSRLTYLVGIKRVSQSVAGRFIGYIDGEPVDGYAVGEVRR